MLAVGSTIGKRMLQKDSFLKTPSWVSEAVVYEIFPDRFCRSGHVEDQEGLLFQKWGSNPTLNGFQGGDLYGIIEKLDYLMGLGITCLYLTPIFLSTANHRYHTNDYFNVDPILGGNKAFKELISAVHKRNMRIVLDGVFNHCGRGFWPFQNLLENGTSSPYIEWFKVNNWPLKPYVKNGEKCGYHCWWNNPALPKFNHNSEHVRNYLISVAMHWVEMGIDGWRLDVADEVPIEFWLEFRNKVKGINSDVWIFGEIWGDARPWLESKCFDGVMNYRIGWSILSWVAGNNLKSNYKNQMYPLKSITTQCFITTLETTFGWYESDINYSQLNLLDSHDVPRALSTLGGDIPALKIALFLLFLQPGASCIYYGTEVGLSGSKDPNCRESFPWGIESNHEISLLINSLSSLKKELLQHIKQRFQWQVDGNNGLFGWAGISNSSRSSDASSAYVFINRSRRYPLKAIDLRGEVVFQLGDVEIDSHCLGPQSAVLIAS